MEIRQTLLTCNSGIISIHNKIVNLLANRSKMENKCKDLKGRLPYTVTVVGLWQLLRKWGQYVGA